MLSSRVICITYNCVCVQCECVIFARYKLTCGLYMNTKHGGMKSVRLRISKCLPLLQKIAHNVDNISISAVLCMRVVT